METSNSGVHNSHHVGLQSQQLEGSFDLGFDSAIKLLEVTAQQVVDRINNPDNSDFEFQTSNSTTPKKLSLVTKGRTLSETSVDSKRNVILGSQGSDENEAQTPVSVIPPGVVEKGPHSSSSSQASPGGSKHEKRRLSLVAERNAQKLLVILKNWVKEANESKGGGKETESFLSSSLSDNSYYLYSIEAFVRDLNWSSQEFLAHKFSSHLLNWVKQLFHFRDSSESELEYNSVLPHWEKYDGMIGVTKWHLHLAFPRFFHIGFESFRQEDRFPAIYSSDEDVAFRVTSSLGLSKECINVIDVTQPDWVNTLEQLILTDQKRNVTPLIFLLNIGKVGKEAEKACHLSEAYKLPVHIYGRNTFSYFVKRAETDQIGTSFTIDMNVWIPSPALPHLTMFKKPKKADMKRLQVAGLSSLSKDLMTLTPWFCAEAFGHVSTKAFVEELCERGQFLLTILKKYDFLTIVPNCSSLTDGQVIVSSLIFLFKPTLVNDLLTTEDEQPSIQYVNVLNSWLYHILERDMKNQLQVEFVDVKGSWNILFDVFKTEKFSSADEEFIEKIFDHHMRVLQSTVSKKSEFSRLVDEAVELESLDYETSWAGLGAVRYIPKFYRETPEGSDEPKRVPPPVPQNEDPELHMKSNINHLNAQIVDKLKSIDNAFSLGVYGSDDWCVQFGMVTDETEVSELLRLVISSGEEIEESSEFFHQMSELVKKGIEKATAELKRESEEALWEEGILRRVPVVGTFVNWFSPPPRETGIRGRALNLVQGRVESTENIYKYHMQVETPSSPTTSSTAILNRINSRTSSLSK